MEGPTLREKGRTTERQRVSTVIVRFNVGIRRRKAQTADDRLDSELGLMRKGIRKDITGGDFDGLLE